jgi:hypothetical protein
MKGNGAPLPFLALKPLKSSRVKENSKNNERHMGVTSKNMIHHSITPDITWQCCDLGDAVGKKNNAVRPDPD